MEGKGIKNHKLNMEGKGIKNHKLNMEGRVKTTN